MIRAILLVDGETLITKVRELEPDALGQPDCELVDPYILIPDFDEPNESAVKLQRWLEDTTRQTIFQISSDKILTMCEPLDDIEERYELIVGKRKAIIQEDLDIDEVFEEDIDR